MQDESLLVEEAEWHTRRGLILCLQSCQHIVADVDDCTCVDEIDDDSVMPSTGQLALVCRLLDCYMSMIALLYIGSIPRINMCVHVIMGEQIHCENSHQIQHTRAYRQCISIFYYINMFVCAGAPMEEWKS